MRIGHGYDVHKFGSTQPLVLGGVTIAWHQGLIAHSDGDVVLHALCDALLGALAFERDDLLQDVFLFRHGGQGAPFLTRSMNWMAAATAAKCSGRISWSISTRL